jgi:hypothetical protein
MNQLLKKREQRTAAAVITVQGEVRIHCNRPDQISSDKLARKF